MVQLFVIGGHDVGRSAELEHGAWVGRAEGCGLRLGDRSISRRHARVEQRGDDWFLVDQGSTNGLHLADERVDEVRLVDHGEFYAGEVHLRARFETAEPEPVAAPAPKAARPSEPAIAFTSGGGVTAEEQPVEELELEWDDEEPGDAGGGPSAAPAPQSPARTGVRDLQRDELLASLGTKKSSSLMSADLSQLPPWAKALAALFLLLFLGLLAWGVSTLVVAVR
ncbi:MAG: FHA domain-containing protein [Planctomycetota bacterium]|nr:FHA domain-containing protein [Planctomycetota bacterium]